MSGTITPYGVLAQVVASTAKIHNSLDILSEQTSTGLVSQSYAGLSASAASTSLNLTPQIQHLQTWKNAVDSATGTIGMTQSVMSQVSSIASTFYADLNNIGSTNASETDSVAANARQALQSVVSLLNTQYGGNYVFSGTDTTNPPVPDAGDVLTSAFFTQIQSAVGGLSSSNAAATAASTLATAASDSPGVSLFSTSLQQPAATVVTQLAQVQTGEGQMQTIGIAASTNSFVQSTGTSTTGSYIRDILRGLATIGSMTSAQTTNGADLTGLVQDTRTSLSGAITALNQDAGVLGDRQTALTALKTNLADTQTTLTGQVSDVQEVDMAKALTELSQLQTQLQASYQVISAVNGMSLAKYL